MDITQMSVVELKSLAYDQLVMIDQCKANLQNIQNEIARKLRLSAPLPQESPGETVENQE